MQNHFAKLQLQNVNRLFPALTNFVSIKASNAMPKSYILFWSHTILCLWLSMSIFQANMKSRLTEGKGLIFLWTWLSHLTQIWVLSQAETIITFVWSFGKTEQIKKGQLFSHKITKKYHQGQFWVNILWICSVCQKVKQ